MGQNKPDQNRLLTKLIEEDPTIKFLFYNEQTDTQDNIKLHIVYNLLAKTASLVRAECEAECQKKIEELIEEIEQAGKEGKVVIYFQSDWWQSLKAKYSNKEKADEKNY